MEATQRFDVVAGYRLIRKLGEGDRSEVFLGHALDSRVPPQTGSSGVAVKVFQPQLESDSIDQEIRARAAVDGDGLAALLDLATMPDGRVCIVLERLDSRSLPAVLAARDNIAAGEAVTLLAPIIVAVAGLHAAGFAHTTLNQAAVQVTGSGRPLLTALGGLREVNAAQSDLIRADYGRLTVLIRSVFDHLKPGSSEGRRAEAVAAWFEMAATRIPFEPCLDELERRLFEWSPATPVAASTTSSDGTRVIPSRVTAPPYAVGAPWQQAATATESEVTHRADTHRAVTRRDGATSGVAAKIVDARPMTAMKGLLRSVLGRRRRSLLVAGCISAALVVLALTLLPPDGQASQADSPHAAPSASAPTTAAPASDPAAGSVPVVPPADASTNDADAIGGDEPVAATSALLRARAVCLSGASVACLDTVDQAGSAALATDRYRLAQGADAGESTAAPRASVIGDPTGDTLSLVERTGDSALIALEPGSSANGKEVHSEPASVLVVKGEAGWRIREIFGY